MGSRFASSTHTARRLSCSLSGGTQRTSKVRTSVDGMCVVKCIGLLTPFKVVLDMDMLYHTKERNAFCEEWAERNGENGEDLYAKHQPLRWKLREEKIIGPKGASLSSPFFLQTSSSSTLGFAMSCNSGPTGTDYLAYLARERKDGDGAIKSCHV